MHPIERLRYVARSGWGGPASLGAEAAYALAELAEQEPAALLTACRRLLERNPACGPLWWVCARVLCAGDAWAEAAHCARLLEDDPTEQLLEVELYGLRAVRHGGVGEVASADVVVVAADVIGPAGMVIDAGDRGLLEAARAVGTDIWVSGGVGRVLPARLWQAMSVRLQSPPRPSRTAASSWFDPVASSAVVDLQAVRKVAGPTGVHESPFSVSHPDCPEPPELVARW